MEDESDLSIECRYRAFSVKVEWKHQVQTSNLGPHPAQHLKVLCKCNKLGKVALAWSGNNNYFIKIRNKRFGQLLPAVCAKPAYRTRASTLRHTSHPGVARRLHSRPMKIFSILVLDLLTETNLSGSERRGLGPEPRTWSGLLISVGEPPSLRRVLTACALFPAPPPPDADDQTGAVQGPRAARAELGALPAQVPPQKPHQAQGAQEEERQEGVHALPALAARQQGMLGRPFNCVCVFLCVPQN